MQALKKRKSKRGGSPTPFNIYFFHANDQILLIQWSHSKHGQLLQCCANSVNFIDQENP